MLTIAVLISALVALVGALLSLQKRNQMSRHSAGIPSPEVKRLVIFSVVIRFFYVLTSLAGVVVFFMLVPVFMCAGGACGGSDQAMGLLLLVIIPTVYVGTLMFLKRASKNLDAMLEAAE